MAQGPYTTSTLLPALFSLLTATATIAEEAETDTPSAEAIAETTEASDTNTAEPATKIVAKESPVTPGAETADISDTGDAESAGTPDTGATAVNPSTSSPAIAQQLSQLISEQQYAQAFALAQQHAPNEEGDATFDFNYGFSAAQSGAYNEAVFVFERLVSNYPDVPRYRLELARCYFHLGQLDTAQQEFERVQAGNPPNQVKNTIQAFLDEIAERRQALTSEFFASASYSAGYDSNINSATDLDEIDILLNGNPQQVRLNPNQKAKGTGFYKLRAQAGYRAPLTQRSGFDIRVGMHRKANAATDDYDLNSGYIDGGFQLIRSRHKLRMGGAIHQYWLSGESLQNQASANLSHGYQLNRPWRLNSRIDLRNNDNKQNDDLDATQLELSSGPAYNGGSFAVQSGVLFSTDSSDKSPLARDTLGLNLSSQLSLSAGSYAYGLLSFRQFDYQRSDANNLLTAGKKRSESLLQFVVGYNRELMPHVSVYAQFSYLDNQSNINIYKYDRSLAEGGVSVSF